MTLLESYALKQLSTEQLKGMLQELVTDLQGQCQDITTANSVAWMDRSQRADFHRTLSAIRTLGFHLMLRK